MNLKKVLGFTVGIVLATQAIAQDKLIFAVDVIRHGDRNPTKDLPSSQMEWPGGLGELTPVGMQQEYTLGQAQRKRYVDEWHLLPANYDPGTLYVRSTNFNRTLMSAESFLYGLYPLGTGAQTLPQAYQPIPIHTVQKGDDSFLIPDESFFKFALYATRYLVWTPEWKQKNIEIKPYFSHWSALTGVPIHHLWDVIFVGDNLAIRKLRHLPYPKGMSDAEANQMIDVSQWIFLKSFSNHPMNKKLMSNLLEKIQAYLQDAKAGKGHLKYVLFSAHDSTITSLASALGASLTEVPHYASDLNIALFQTGEQQYIVKISLNGAPLKLESCEKEDCRYEEFQKL